MPCRAVAAACSHCPARHAGALGWCACETAPCAPVSCGCRACTAQSPPAPALPESRCRQAPWACCLRDDSGSSRAKLQLRARAEPPVDFLCCLLPARLRLELPPLSGALVIFTEEHRTCRKRQPWPLPLQQQGPRQHGQPPQLSPSHSSRLCAALAHGHTGLSPRRPPLCRWPSGLQGELHIELEWMDQAIGDRRSSDVTSVSSSSRWAQHPQQGKGTDGGAQKQTAIGKAIHTEC